MNVKIKNEYLKHKETIHNFTWRSLQVFGKQGITFIIFFMSAFLLIPEDLGRLTYALSIIYLFALFSDFGIASSVNKYTAEYNATNKESLKFLIPSGLLIITILTSFIYVLFFIIGKIYLKDFYTYFLTLLPLVFLIPAVNLYEGFFMGLKKFKIIALTFIIGGIISLPIIYLLISRYYLFGAFIAQNVFYLILFILQITFLREFKIRIDPLIVKKIVNYSLILGLSALGFFLYTRIDILILGNANYLLEVAHYELLIKIFTLLIVPFTILGQITAPNISELFYFKEYKKLKIKYKKFLLFSLTIGLILAVLSYLIFLLLAPIILHKFNFELLYPIFLGFTLLLPIKAIGVVINTSFITPIGKAKLIMYPLIIGGILNLILDLILVNIDFIYVIYSTFLINFLNILFTNILFYKEVRRLRDDA